MYLSQIDKVFLVPLVFVSFFRHVSAQKLQSENFDCAKELAFRKFACLLTVDMIMILIQKLPKETLNAPDQRPVPQQSLKVNKLS